MNVFFQMRKERKMAQVNVYFIRHGLTYYNSIGCCCGRTDALVCEEGRKELIKLRENYEYPKVEQVYTSPAIRCRETADVFFPNQNQEVVYGFWELDFGEFEKQPMASINGMEAYDKWLRQDLDCRFPGGETLLEARFRVQSAMTRIVTDCIEKGYSEIAIVAHGEILSLLMSACLVTTEPREAFMLCPNGMGYAAVLNTDTWFEEQKMNFNGYIPEGAPRLKPEDSPYFVKIDKEE